MANSVKIFDGLAKRQARGLISNVTILSVIETAIRTTRLTSTFQRIRNQAGPDCMAFASESCHAPRQGLVAEEPMSSPSADAAETCNQCRPEPLVLASAHGLTLELGFHEHLHPLAYPDVN